MEPCVLPPARLLAASTRTLQTLRQAFWQRPRASPATAFYLLGRSGVPMPGSKSPLNYPNPAPSLLAVPRASPATAFYFLGRSGVPFARPQMYQMLRWSSSARCQPRPCLFRTFKPAVCQPSNVPNAPLQLFFPLPAAALFFLERSSLPFASPQTTPNAPLQLPCPLPASALSF